MNILAMPIGITTLIVVGSSVVCSILAVYAIRRRKLHLVFCENNEFIGINYPTVGLIYGVFLAFAIVIAWGRFEDAEESATSEVTYLSELWRDAQVFPNDARKDVQNRILTYSREVVDTEWDSMANRGKGSFAARDAYERIWDFYYQFRPEDDTQMVFYTESISQLNELGKQRRQRILFSTSEVHGLLWSFLIGGAVVTIVFALLVGTSHGWTQALVMSLLTSLISFSVLMVYSLQHPFTGDVSVGPDAFARLTADFERRQQKTATPHK